MTGEERRTVIGLWSVAGVGAQSIAAIRAVYPGLEGLAAEHPRRWVSSVLVPAIARDALLELPTALGAHADQVLEAAARAGMSIAFPDDSAYPRGLGELHNAPAVLFYQGRGDRPNARRRLAVVGSRSFEPNFVPAAMTMARELGTRVIVVSGGARGIDQLFHNGAIEAGGETWAFMGAGLDQLDPSQAALAPRIVGSGGTVFSELPPGVRADKQTFPRRNRLISGSADAVLLARATSKSGALITIRYAREQGKLVLAVPGQIDHDTAYACNQLIRGGVARLVTGAAEIFADMGLDDTRTPEVEVAAAPVDLGQLSANARVALDLLARSPADFESLLERAGPLDSGRLSSALVELELAGLLVQRPGRRYERR